MTIEPWTRCLAGLFLVKPNDRVGYPIRREVYDVFTEVMPLTWVENDADNNPVALGIVQRSNGDGSVCQCLLTISWSISSIECGEIPSSPSPGVSGLGVLSICISST